MPKEKECLSIVNKDLILLPNPSICVSDLALGVVSDVSDCNPDVYGKESMKTT